MYSISGIGVEPPPELTTPLIKVLLPEPLLGQPVKHIATTAKKAAHKMVFSGLSIFHSFQLLSTRNESTFLKLVHTFLYEKSHKPADVEY